MKLEAWETQAPQGHSWTSLGGLAPVAEGWSLSVRLLGRPAGRSVSAHHCVVPVVMGLLAFCNGLGVGRPHTHASCGDWRFLFSQAPDLLLPMWKQGQLQPGWLPTGRPTLPREASVGLPPQVPGLSWVA